MHWIPQAFRFGDTLPVYDNQVKGRYSIQHSAMKCTTNLLPTCTPSHCAAKEHNTFLAVAVSKSNHIAKVHVNKTEKCMEIIVCVQAYMHLV